MSKLKLISARRMEQLLLSLGFIKVRHRGGHAQYVHADGRKTTVSFYGNTDLPRPMIRTILSEISLGIDEYNDRV